MSQLKLSCSDLDGPVFLLGLRFKVAAPKFQKKFPGDVKFESPREEAEALNSDDEDNVVHEIVVPTCSYRFVVTKRVCNYVNSCVQILLDPWKYGLGVIASAIHSSGSRFDSRPGPAWY